MLLPVLLLSVPSLVRANNSPLGVSPELRALYIPSSSSSSSSATWKCLNSSEEILWSEINDDYCDCLDGSDEPGTSACVDSIFYCANEGHIGAHIQASRVHDGKCEPECCDGSDEPAGVCPNICKEVGEEYRRKLQSERKLRKTGSKIRATYIVFAHKEKKRLEDSTSFLEREIAAREKEVARLKDIMDQTESLSSSAMEYKKQSPLYQSLLTHHRALKSLQRAYSDRVDREKRLGEILEALKKGYNPNYQDMAVLEAVRGWEEMSLLSTTKDADENASEEQTESGDTVTDEGDWNEEQLDSKLNDLLAQDHVSLLLDHETHISQGSSSLLFDISAYLPDGVLEWLRVFGIIRGSSTDSDTTNRARTAYTEAESKLNAVKSQKRDEDDELVDLFDPKVFGREGEWKKLQGLCLTKDSGGYLYEVCLFGGATQKEGGSQHNLGKFSSWNTDPNIKPDDPRYYQVQHYTGGARCWNGPERSVTLHLSCGTENALLTVAEPEKCDYHLTGTTPALCLPLEDENRREEL